MYIATPPTQLNLLQGVRLMVRKEIPDFEILFQDTLGQFLHEKLKLSDCGDEKIEGLSFEILSLAEMEICYQVSLITLYLILETKPMFEPLIMYINIKFVKS